MYIYGEGQAVLLCSPINPAIRCRALPALSGCGTPHLLTSNGSGETSIFRIFDRMRHAARLGSSALPQPEVSSHRVK